MLEDVLLMRRNLGWWPTVWHERIFSKMPSELARAKLEEQVKKG